MQIRYKIMGISLLGTLITNLGLGMPPAIAQLLYPPASDRGVISVTGQGRASVPADFAQVEMRFTNYDPNAAYYPYDIPPGESEPIPEPPPITRVSLQEVVSALTAAGVPESAIQVNVPIVDAPTYYYYSTETSLALDLEEPTRDQVNSLIQAVNNTLENQSPQQTIFMSGVFVQYAIESCTLVEQRAYTAAMEDARLRAGAIADTMDVSLVTPPSVAEMPFLGRLFSPCNEDTDVIGELFWGAESNFYDPDAPAEVTVYREIMVTYSVD